MTKPAKTEKVVAKKETLPEKASQPFNAAAAFFCDAAQLWNSAKTKEDRINALQTVQAAFEVGDCEALVAVLVQYNENAETVLAEADDDVAAAIETVAADDTTEASKTDESESEEEEESEVETEEAEESSEDEEEESTNTADSKRAKALAKAVRAKRVQANLAALKGK